MPSSIPSSSTSAAWRPADAAVARLALRSSPLLVAALLMLACAAGFAALASEMPRGAAWLVAMGALAYGGGLALHEARRPARELVAGAGRASVDGRPVDALSVRWRGPIAFVQWRQGDGRRGQHVFLPDTLPAAGRRELRLAVTHAGPARQPASVAP